MIIPMRYNKFGHRFNVPLNNWRRQRHSGIDLNLGSGSNDLGLPILSPLDGRVVYSGRNGGWGHVIIIRHDLPQPFEYKGKKYTVIWSRQAHLQKRLVGLDELVQEGQQIGTCGGTGWYNKSYSPHNHWDIILEHLDPVGGWGSYTSYWSAAKVEKYYADPIDFTEKYNAFLESFKKKEDILRDDELIKAFDRFKKVGMVKDDVRHKTLISFGQMAEIYFKILSQINH